MIKHRLFSPGPTSVPPRVLLAMAQPIVHHRTPQFSALFDEVRAGLRKLFQTEQEVLILAASGTGAMEAAVSNSFSRGEKVLVVNAGKFGDRWLKLCESFEVAAIEIAVDWGRAVRLEQVETALKEHPDACGILVQATETSTTVRHPIERLASLARERGILMVVDGITAVGVYDLPMDELGIDVLVSGSQKALMLPPGLSFVSLSERAWARVKKAGQSRFYFDLVRERDSQAKSTTAYSPAISLINGLRESLAMIGEEGLQAVFARHETLARAARAAVQALDLCLLASEDPSPAVTGMYVPDGIDGGELLGYLRDQMRVTFGGGQDRLKGRVVRIGHLGYADMMDTITAVAALEMALCHFGHPVTMGRGVAAAQEVLMASLPE